MVVPLMILKFKKGLRQGDLLASFLFLIAADDLSSLIGKIVELDYLQGYKVSQKI